MIVLRDLRNFIPFAIKANVATPPSFFSYKWWSKGAHWRGHFGRRRLSPFYFRSSSSSPFIFSSRTPSSPYHDMLVFFVLTLEVLRSFAVLVSSSRIESVLFPCSSLRVRVLDIQVVVVRWGQHFCGVVCSCACLLCVRARC